MEQPQTIKIDDIEYIKKDSILPEVNKDKVIVRSYGAGVFFGTISDKQVIEGIVIVTMTNVRRIWYWDGAASLSQLAIDGTSKPDNCKFSIVVPEQEIINIIEIIPCTDKAIKSIDGVKIWRQ